MYIKAFKLSELRELEENTGISVIEVFKTSSVYGLVLLIAVNHGITEEQAGAELDAFIETHDLSEAFKLVIDKVFPTSNKPREQLDLRKYKTLTELYTSQQAGVMNSGISFSEFWGSTITTVTEMSDSLATKIRRDQYSDTVAMHNQAYLFAAAQWGKLPKLPEFEEEQGMSDLTVVNTTQGEMTFRTFNITNTLLRSAGEPMINIIR